MTAWWHPDSGGGGLERWLRDFLRDVLQRLGMSELLADPSLDPATLLDDPRSFGMSSLDMITMASRAASSLGLDRTGLSDLLLARRSFQGWLDVMRRSLQIDDSRFGFYSSGSTGSPVMSTHTASHLMDECESFARLFKQIDMAPRRVVATVPSHHIYGFIWTQLLPNVLSVPVNTVNPHTTLPASWVKSLQDHDLLVCTPHIWHLILQLNLTLPEHFIGVSSGGKLAEEDAHTIRLRYPHASLIEVYGSTETAGIAYRLTDGGDYQLLPYWQLDQEQDGWRLRHREYDLDIALQDDIRANGRGTIRVLGRRDDTVKINGHNTHLPTLASTLARHKDVTAAVAQASGPEHDRRLHVYLALDLFPDDRVAWCQQYSNWMAEQLGNAPPPASVVLGPSIPRSALGKPVSWQPNDFPLIEGTHTFRSAFADSGSSH